ncbi:transposase [Chloroflexota bacterium]
MMGVVCKYCNSPNIVRYGFVGGTQKYLCKDCKRKFSVNDHLYRMKTPADQVVDALNDYYGGKSIGDICKSDLVRYGNQPSTKTVYGWITKYTDEAVERFRDCHPKVGDVWTADETMLRIDGANIWLYDIIDEKTRFMLASRVALSRTTEDAKQLLLAAAKRAGKTPKVVKTDRNASYLDGIETAFGADTEHRLGGPFTLVKEDSTSLIERFHGTLKSRTKVMRGLKSVDTAIQFADGFLTYYNFLRPHEGLDGQTPAEVAGIDYPTRTWADVIHNTEPRVEVLTTPEKIVIISEQKPLVRPTTRRRYKPHKPRLRKRKSTSDARTSLARISTAKKKP